MDVHRRRPQEPETGAQAADVDQSQRYSRLSKRGKDSPFLQQTLPAWQPIIRAGTVMPAFFIIGTIFVPVGALLLWYSVSLHELVVDYTDCISIGDASVTCANEIESLVAAEPNKSATELVCHCRPIPFKLDTDWPKSVFMYYALTNFFQNHRRYVKSRDDSQLLGRLETTVSSDCEPFDKDADGHPYVPCGAIANSLFSDTISLRYIGSDGQNVSVGLIRRGITWSSDRTYKFNNPPGQSVEEAVKAVGGVKPRDWHRELWELDVDDPDNNGLINEDLIVWMRPAALPNFRKLYRKIDHADESPFARGMPSGQYELSIEYRFRVAEFGGTKSVVLATTSWFGCKNGFIAYAYIAVGVICLLLGIIFFVIDRKYDSKRTAEAMQITPTSPYRLNSRS